MSDKEWGRVFLLLGLRLWGKVGTTEERLGSLSRALGRGFHVVEVN